MNPYVQLLYAAVASKYGVIVEHEDPPSARSQFSLARKAHGDPILSRISVTISEDQPKRLYLVKCPDEKQNLLAALTSGSIPQTLNGSKPPTEILLESPKSSEPSSEDSGER
jgi:hypothetical protein